MPFCSSCGAQIDAGAKFCAGCGQPAGNASAGPATSSLSTTTPNENFMAAAAYAAIPAVAFLFVEPYKSNSKLRFHSYQALLFFAAWFLLRAATAILAGILSWIGLGAFMTGVGWLISLACLALWGLLIFKALIGEEYTLPVIGDLARQKA